MIMKKLLKNGIVRLLILTILFGAVYALLTCIVEGFVEIDKVLLSMFSYFLFMCLFHFIAPGLRKITGHDNALNTTECDK